MIQNDEQLEVVRLQLSRAEAALESLRRDVLPKSESMYRVMAESYVDTILDLRRLIDTYLGICPRVAPADLVISLEGERVGLGQTSAAAVTRIIDAFRRGVQSVVEMVEAGNRPRSGRRRERWIENICDFPIIGLQPGSVQVLLAKPEDETLFSEDNRATLQAALDLFFAGLQWADCSREAPNTDFERLEAEKRQTILALVTQLLPPRTGDVSAVSFRQTGPTTDQPAKLASLTRPSRERIRAALKAMVQHSEFREITGVIRELDLDDRSFDLRDRDDRASDLRCVYGAELEETVKEYLDSRVTVTGTLELNRKQKEKLLVDSIEAAGEYVSEELPEN
jgi:hypothetical protein